jgi:hypothetical protein
MAHRAVILSLSFALAACGGSIEHVPSSTAQSQQTTDEEAPPPPPPAKTAEAAPAPEAPKKPPPHGYGGVCGACVDEHWVCCPDTEPCAGKCVPDCRPAPDRCPDGTTCDDASGVCLRR